MACEIQRPTPQALFDRNRDMFSTTVLQGAQIIPESNEWYVVSLNYAVAEEFYAFSEQMWKEQDARYACCDNLVDIAARDGVFLNAATYAQGYVRLTGVAGAALPDSIEVTIGSKTYLSEGSLPDIMPETGTTVVRVRSEIAGASQNGPAPATGLLSTAIPDVNQTVQVCGGFCGGEEQETCEQLRSRYLKRKQFAPKAINKWVEDKLMEWPCVTRVCARGGSCCTISTTGDTCDCGSPLGYHIFMDNSFECGIVPDEIVTEIQEWMFGPENMSGMGMGQVEVGVCGKLYPVKAAHIDVTISDYGCISNDAKNEIRTRLAEYFRTLCPSTELQISQFSTVVGSVLGFGAPYAVDIEPAAGTDELVTELSQNCGYELNCDVAACLGAVTFIDTVPDNGVC